MSRKKSSCFLHSDFDVASHGYRLIRGMPVPVPAPCPWVENDCTVRISMYDFIFNPEAR